MGYVCMFPGLAPAHPYRALGPPEMQVDSLARLVEMSLHILFPKAQECVHTDVEATLRFLQDRGQRRKHREDEPWPSEESKTWLRNCWFQEKRFYSLTLSGSWQVT